jgi:hypothetical protein
MLLLFFWLLGVGVVLLLNRGIEVKELLRGLRNKLLATNYIITALLLIIALIVIYQKLSFSFVHKKQFLLFFRVLLLKGLLILALRTLHYNIVMG